MSLNFAGADTREEGRSLNDLRVLFFACVGGIQKTSAEIFASHFSRLVSYDSIYRFLRTADDCCTIRRSLDPLDPKDRGKRASRRHYHVQDGRAERRCALLRSL